MAVPGFPPTSLRWLAAVACAAAVAALTAVTPARAQTLNPDFFITNGQVSAQALVDSTLYVGGSFSFVGPITGAGLTVDSVTALPTAGFPKVNGTVIVAVPDSLGGWFIGGQFTTVGDSARSNIAHVNADLSLSPWNPSADGIVRALLMVNHTLYVGGDFLSLGGTARSRAGAVDDSLGVVTAWNPNVNSSVRAFAAGPTFLYVGGQFTSIGGQFRNRVAACDYTTGVADPIWDANANGSVLALWMDPVANVLYVGGQFTFIDSQFRGRIAQIDPATGAATLWNAGSSSAVFSIVSDQGIVYVGGQFTNIGGQIRNHIAALSGTSALATPWDPNASNNVQTLALSGSTVYAGGDFLTIGGQSRSRVAALDINTGLATAWSAPAFGTVSTVDSQLGQVFVGGSFNGLGGIARNNLAAFNTRTGQPTAWNPNADNQVQALLLTPTQMLVGGNFLNVGGVPRTSLAAVDLVNGAPSPWAPACNGQVSALALAGTRLYVGGLFTSLGGQPRVNLGAVDMTTGLAQPWIADTDGQVFALDASTPAIRVGGNFLTLDGQPRNFIGAVDAATSAATRWIPDASGIVRTIVPGCDLFYVGGFFTGIGGQARNFAAAVDPDSGLATPWDPNANGAVFSILPRPGAIYLGGIMTTVGADTRNRVAAVDATTAATLPWDPNSNGTVRALAADADHVFIGGVFSTLGGLPAGNVASSTPDVSIPAATVTLPAASLPAGLAGSAYAASVAAGGGTAPYCYAVTSGALPGGVVLDPATGQLSGSPTGDGLFAFTITATDAHGFHGSQAYSVTVTWTPGIVIIDQPSNVVAGVAMAPAVRVHLANAAGNSIAGQAVSLSLIGTGTLTGGAGIATDANGLVSFPGLSVNLAGAKQLRATATGQTPDTSTVFTVSAAAAASLSFAVQPTTVVAGVNIAPPVQVLVRDAFTNPVAGTSVSLALVGTGVLNGGAAVVSDANGIAAFPALNLTLTGSKQLTASSAPLPNATSTAFTVTAGPPASLAIVVQPTNVVAGAAVAPPVQVKVLDSFGNGVPGANVALALVGTGALTGGAAVAADAQGIASFSNLRVDLVGSKQLTASSGALPTVTTNAFTVSAAAAASLSFSVQPANVVAGVAIAPAVKVQVRDAFTNPVAGTPVTLALLGTGTLTGGGATASDAAGIATFSGVSVNLAGSKQLRASSGALPTATSTAFTVSAAAAATLSFSVQPANAVAGVSLAPAVQVLVRDAFTNPVAGSSVGLALVGTGTLTGGGAVVSDTAGIARFAALKVDLIGSKQLTAASGALPTATSTAFTISAAAAANLSFAVQPTNAVAGVAVAPAVQVLVRDAFTNPVSGTSVSLALVGTGTLTGGGAVVSNASGIASFSGVSINLVGSKQLTATSGVLPSATSSAFTISPAAPASLSYVVQPTSVVAGVAIAPAVQVRVRDAFTNNVPGASVSLALVGTGTLTGGGATASDASGIATFSSVSVNLVGSKQLNASCAAITPVTSSSFTVSAAAAAALSFTAQPTNVVAGVAIAPAVQVKVTDAFGNAVSGTSVSLALVGTGTLTGGGAKTSNASGIASFSTLSVNLAGSKQLTATSGVLPSATSSAFTVSPAAAASLAVATQPSDVVAGAAMAPAVQIEVSDAFGNAVPGASVSLALVGNGTLGGGGATPSNASGIASFANLSVDLVGSKQLTASSGALPTVTTAAFDVTPAAAAALSFAAQPSDVVAGASMSPAVQVLVQDAFGNHVPGAPVTLALVGGGPLGGGTATPSDANGIASFASLSVNLAGSRQLSATSGTAPAATSSAFTVSPAAAAALSFATPPTDVTAGVAIAPAVQVKVVDAFGNGVPGTAVALALVGSGTLSGGDATASDAGGIATFAAVSVDLSGSKQLTASSALLPDATSGSFTVNAAAPVALAFTAQPGDVVAGVAIAPAVQVKSTDAFGNGVPGTSVALALVGAGTLSGGTATATDAEGVASFAALSVDLVGAKSLTASSGALPTATSGSFMVSHAAAAAMSFVVQPSAVVAGATVAPPVQVKVVDGFGNTVAGTPVALILVGGGTLTGGGATPSDTSGIATFAALSINTAGGKQLRATSTGLTNATSAPFNVRAGDAVAISFTVQPSNVAAGVSMTPAVQAKVVDALGNGVSGASVTLALVGTGTLTGGGPIVTNSLGVASFPAIKVNLVGSKQLVATTGALTPATSNAFTVSAGAAAALSFVVQPSAVAAGAAIAPAVQVRVADASGNSIAGASVALSLVGTGTLTGGGAVVSDTAGIARFAGLSVNLTGSKNLRATSGTLPAVNSAAFAVSAGAAATLSFTVQPSTVVAGATMTPAVQVKVVDGFGNVVPGASVSLALAGTGTLTGGGATASNASGIATFGSLHVDLTGSKQLTASSGAVPVATSAAFTVNAAAAAALAFVAQPSNVVAGVTMTPAVQVKVTDAFGNNVAGTSVTLALQGTGTLTGGGAVVSNASGIASFAGLKVNLSGSKQLVASAGALTPAVSASFTVAPAAATTLAFVTQPSTVAAGSTITPAPQVKASDAFGNAVPGVAITMQLVGPGTLTGGAATPTGADGIASFPSLVVRRSGSFVLVAVAGALPSATSTSFTVTCPPITLGPATLADGLAGSPYSQALNAGGGVAPYTFLVTTGAAPAGLALTSAGVLSGTPAAGGVTSFTVTATDANGCTGTQVFAITVVGVPAAATDLVATRLLTGNDNSGRIRIQLTFSTTQFTSSAEVWRAPFGGYPQYDKVGGHTPATPVYPPPAPWTKTDVTASGQADQPPSRDAWAYVVFLKNNVGSPSLASNQTPVQIDYLLGDVSNGTERGIGDNVVEDADLSLLGAHYGADAARLSAGKARYLDIGPTLERALDGRPMPDGHVDFEDLFVLASNYGATSVAASAMAFADAAAEKAKGPEQIELRAPSLVDAGDTFEATLAIDGSGRVQGLSARLAWDPSVVVPEAVTRTPWLEAQNGMVLSAEPGGIDVALLGTRELGLAGAGDLATVRFHALRVGDPQLKIDHVDARDAANRTLGASALQTTSHVAPPSRTLLLAPAPNPARGPVQVTFALAQAGRVDLAIYSVDGRRVRTLAGGVMPAGSYHLTWPGDDDAHRGIAPGVYFTQLVANGRRYSQKLVHIQ